jgi:hypothetical protein
MLNRSIVAALALPLLAVACAPAPRYSYSPSTYTPPPPPPEPGVPITLTAQDQQAIKAGVAKGMKDPESARFGEMAAARKSDGTITVCGYVNGKNSYGGYVGMSPFIGIYAREAKAFGLVDIGSSSTDRTVVGKMCRDAGIPIS